MATPEDVLAFWFGPEWPEVAASGDVRARWFRKDKAFDEQIRQRFGSVHEEACAGRLDSWCSTPRGCLALIIVLDQFSRNLYRDDPHAWAADEHAQRHSLALIESGQDAELPPQGRVFSYMPLMHAEDRELQALSVAKFEELAREDSVIGENTRYAVQHKEIIDRFGRFPHRNAVLARESTAEEEAFLEQPGSSF